MALFLNSFWINLDQQFPNYLQLVDIYYDTILVFTKSELSLSFFLTTDICPRCFFLYPGWKAAMPLIVSHVLHATDVRFRFTFYLLFFTNLILMKLQHQQGEYINGKKEKMYI